MKRIMRGIKYILICLLLTGLLISGSLNGQNRQRLLMDHNWKFQLGDSKDAENISFDDIHWRLLNLPHDWSIEGEYNKDAATGGSGGYLPTGIGWYRRHFNVTKDDLNKNIRIEFDGVYMNSDVWINGQHLGNYPYGYSSFYYELTPYLVEGENIISVRVDNSLQPNTRWYSGSGIYRHVWLVITDPLHISHWGVSATTPEVSEESAVVSAVTGIENNSNNLKNGILHSVIVNASGNKVSDTETSFSLKPHDRIEINQKLKVTSPALWSIEKPELYTLHSKIVEGEKQVDEVITNIGIRKIEYNVDKGFFLNGKHVKMNGVCLHHDGGCVGSAVPEIVWERRLRILKEMGCNAIRTSHNPPAPEFLDLCDKMGFLVMDEPFDEWKIGKRKYGYHDYFDKWWKNDLVSMIHRDRNHPSIVLWSAGNEIPEQKTEDGAKILSSLVETYHNEDPTRPVTLACDNIAADGGSTTLAFLKELDIVGYNYVDRWHERRELYYDIDRHDHPDWKMTGTESGSNSGVIRGEYSLGIDPSIVHPNYNSRMFDAEQLWKFVGTHEYVIGDFMWTGIDYLGESFWPSKSDNFGVLDLCGFPKDGFYFYQSQWTTKPMIHLFPHWNWQGREGQVIPVLCYTNCDAVELFLNGKSFGEKRIEFPRQGNSGGWNKYDKPQIHPTTADLHLQWDIPYEPGILKAVGKKEGNIVCVYEIHTAGIPEALRLKVDRENVIADLRDIANVEIEVVDHEGNIVPTANNLIQFSIEGEGNIIGVDNGNPVDHDSYKVNRRNSFNGLSLVVIQSLDKSGKIKLIAKSEGLKDASIEINVTKGKSIPVLP
jgi:beta-galactosidase